MAVPKYKKSKSKTRSRVAQWSNTDEPSLSTCDNCKNEKESHRVCMECGHYRGRQVIEIDSGES